MKMSAVSSRKTATTECVFIRVLLLLPENILRECRMVMYSVAFVRVRLCVSVSVCPVRALNFESLDLVTSFLIRRY